MPYSITFNNVQAIRYGQFQLDIEAVYCGTQLVWPTGQFYGPNPAWLSCGFTGNGTAAQPLTTSAQSGVLDGGSIKILEAGKLRITADSASSDVEYDILINGVIVFARGDNNGWSGPLNETFPITARGQLTFRTEFASYTNLRIWWIPAGAGDVGLPYTTTLPPPVGSEGQVNGDWTIFGTLQSTVAGVAALMTGLSGATHNTIRASDVTITGSGQVISANHSFELRARVNGNTYYAAEYGPGPNSMRILRCFNGTVDVLKTRSLAFANNVTMSFTVKGDTLSVTVGGVTETVTDGLIGDPGGVGFAVREAACALKSFSAESAT
jgi:hypothetical protein